MTRHGIRKVWYMTAKDLDAIHSGPKGHVVTCLCGHQTEPHYRLTEAYRLYHQHVQEEWALVNTFTGPKLQEGDGVLGSQTPSSPPAVSSPTAGGQPTWLPR